MSLQYDIVIVGGGLVGASFAAKILQKNMNLKIALIDNAVPKNDPVLFMPRNDIQSDPNIDLNAKALALSHSSVICLQSLGVMQKLASQQDIKAVHVSSKGHFGVSRISAIDAGLSALGVVVNADVLNHTLNMHIEGKLKIYRPVYVVKMMPQEKGWTLLLNTGEVINTELLVAADGTNSFVRQTVGIDVNSYDYHQSAISVNIELLQSHDNVAYERFTEDGAIAMLPFGERLVKCVWVLPNNKASLLLQKNDTEFLQDIQTVFGFRLGRLKHLGKRIAYPLKSLSAQTLYEHHCVLLGNAANTLHPIAAQGFNLGLRDAVALSKLVIASVLNGQDIGANTLLKQYAESRQADHQRTRYFIDNIAESKFSPNLGVLACEFLPLTKKWVVAQGLGSQV